MKMQTNDLADENFKKLKELFPNAVTETTDENGEVVRAIDADVLRQEINTSVVDGPEERYQFTWPGKRESIRLAAAPIAASLRPCREESVNFDTTENVYIEGDNLDVLKLLRETYLGRVKMIYIDPPYNTGNDFIYEDDFAGDTDEFLLRDNQYDNQGNRLVQNTESNGRFHTDWLNMIYPRLRVARDLMAEDGMVFISIGEHEISNLKKVCIDIFGEQNYIETYIWESTFRPDNSSKIIRRNAEYVIGIAKSKNAIKALRGEIKSKEGLPSLTKSNMKESVLRFPANTVKTLLSDGLYHSGVRDSYELLDDVVVENGVIVNSFSLKGRVIWSQENLMKEIANGTEIIIKGNGFVPYTKKAGDSQMSPAKIIPKTIVGDILSANAEMSALFEHKVFSYPKPVSLLRYLINFFDDKNALIVDFFSGSSTTAEAVMAANAQVGGNRSFIMVQLPENLDENLNRAEDKEKVILRNAIELCNSMGVSHTLCEIGKERIRRAGKRIKDEIAGDISKLEEEIRVLAEKKKNQGDSILATEEDTNLDELKRQLIVKQHALTKLDIGFRVFKLDSSNMKDVYYSPSETPQSDLLGRVDNIKEGRTPEDLLFQVMLEFGIPLSSKIRESVIAGKKVFNVEDNFLIACFDDDITNETISAIAKEKPQYVVLCDSGFETDSVAANFEQIFATYSPDTTRRIL